MSNADINFTTENFLYKIKVNRRKFIVILFWEDMFQKWFKLEIRLHVYIDKSVLCYNCAKA